MIVIQSAVILFQFITSVFLYSRLPRIMPTHWNVYGAIDGTMPKEFAAFLFPVMGLALLVLFKIAPYFDPKKKKYDLFAFEWQIVQTAFIVFFAYIQGITFYAAFHPSLIIMKPLFIGMGILFILLGNYLSKIRQNYFIGIRVPWTLDNEDNWNKTHRFASWTFVIMGMVVFAEAFVIWQAFPIILGSIFLAASLPVLYSYLLFKKKEKYMRYILISIALAITLLVAVRTLSGEDEWICKNGVWKTHGNPRAQKPLTPCGQGQR